MDGGCAFAEGNASLIHTTASVVVHEVEIHGEGRLAPKV
jgi:hypothetical protein